MKENVLQTIHKNMQNKCSCGNDKDIRSKHCSKCYIFKLKENNNNNYKHGRYCTDNFCIDCNKLITTRALRCKSCCEKYKQKGEKNGNYKNGKSHCIDCGIEISKRDAKRCWKCYVKWSQIPKNNANYVHGKCYEPYPLGWNNTFKEQIRYRDSYKCLVCGCHEVENCRKLDVHHIDYDKNNLNKNNLITLCQKCHGKTNFNREYWKNLLNDKIVRLYDLNSSLNYIEPCKSMIEDTISSE